MIPTQILRSVTDGLYPKNEIAADLLIAALYDQIHLVVRLKRMSRVLLAIWLGAFMITVWLGYDASIAKNPQVSTLVGLGYLLLAISFAWVSVVTSYRSTRRHLGEVLSLAHSWEDSALLGGEKRQAVRNAIDDAIKIP